MNTKLLALTAIITPMLIACTSPAEGDWVSKERVASERNEMSLEDDGTGDGRIYYFSNNTPFYNDFDVTWEDEGDQIAIELECEGNCGELDFEMECELNDDDDEMDCDGDGAFSDYRFEWNRD